MGVLLSVLSESVKAKGVEYVEDVISVRYEAREKGHGTKANLNRISPPTSLVHNLSSTLSTMTIT